MAYKCSPITPILKWILERGMEGRVLTSSVSGYGQEEGWCEPDICLRVPSNASSVLTRWGNIKFSGKTLLCGGCEVQWIHLNLRTSRVLSLAAGDKLSTSIQIGVSDVYVIIWTLDNLLSRLPRLSLAIVSQNFVFEWSVLVLHIWESPVSYQAPRSCSSLC